jgi:putative phage-type endonuclease
MALTAEQQQARASGIGGSDCAAALGLSPWKAPIELYHQKCAALGDDVTIEIETTPNEPMRWGILLEPVIRQEYASRTGRSVHVPPATLVHPEHSFMVANVDGITSDERLLEVKTARSAQGWGEPDTDQIPQNYLLQVQHYLCITSLPVADVAVLIGGQEYRQYEIPADRELQEMLIEGERAFWDAVLSRTPPEVDLTHPRALEIVRKLNPGTNGEILTADAMLDHWRVVYEDASERAQVYHGAADTAKAHLMWAMGEAAELRFLDGKALRRKLQTRKAYSVPETTFIDARWIQTKS